ncbi:MAG: ECF-type sigma factor [Steroidobacter sp.]
MIKERAALALDPKAAELFPQVYAELRRLAACQMGHVAAGSTLQPTALVHEVWLRLGRASQGEWCDRSHFFAAAAEAMRHILIDRARRNLAIRHGGGRRRVDIATIEFPICLDDSEHLLALDLALEKLAQQHADAAELVKLHCFVGLDIEDAALALGLARATAYRRWVFARAWLYDALVS